MANEKKPPFIIRPRFLLFVLYLIVYVGLRYRDEMIVQTVGSQEGGTYQMVMPNMQHPRWRRQLWRAVFSLPMVVEEEGRRAAMMGDGFFGGALGELLGPYIGDAGGAASPGGGGAGHVGGGAFRPASRPPPSGMNSGHFGGGQRRSMPPGGLTTDEIIDNHVRTTEMAGQAAAAAARGISPGDAASRE